MRLPINRRLNEPVLILGLSVLELAIAGGTTVVIFQLFSGTTYGGILSYLFGGSLAAIFLFVKRKYEKFFLEKFFRFMALPEHIPNVSNKIEMRKTK
jgi:hypothetical protein